MKRLIQYLTGSSETYTTTENGARSLITTGDPRVDYFFKVLRDTDGRQIRKYLKECVNYSVDDTFKLLFQLRDREKEGKGERSAFLTSFNFLLMNSDVTRDRCLANLENVPYYGRWKDLFDIYSANQLDDTLRDEILDYTAEQLETDLANSQSDKDEIRRSVSLCAKWIPSEGHGVDKKCGFTSHLAKYMQLTKGELRKRYITPLRQHINVTERLICSQRFEEIDYKTVPGGCMKKERKTFRKHDPYRFALYERSLVSGRVKAKTTGVEANELVKHYLDYNPHDAVIEGMANEFQRKVSESLQKSAKNILFVVDVSASMNASNMRPLSSAIALGIFGSAATQGAFHNKVITFSEEPEVVTLPDESESFQKRVMACRSMKWGASTDIQKVFDLILNIGKLKGQDALPDMICIATDMQFTKVDKRFTNLEVIDQKFRDSGLTRPQLVCWNLRGNTLDFPVCATEPEITLISGHNPLLMNLLLTEGDINPSRIVDTAINIERYDRVV